MNTVLNDASVFIRLILDILVVWALIYYGLRIVRNNTRTIQIFKGILVVLFLKGISVALDLQAFGYIINIFLQWGVLAIIIVFQPEIRGMLEKLGKTTSFSVFDLSRVQYEQMIQEITNACEVMSKSKTGALITIQQAQQLTDYVSTGIQMDSVVSKELLLTIFQYGTPMHDGAVIIQGNKIACAAAYFPPTVKDLPSKYGARHRAAVGISEITDSITIIVSEETGAISVAVHGQMTQYPVDGLKRYLTNMLIPEHDEAQTNALLKTAKNLGFTRSKRTPKKENVDERIEPLEVVDLYNEPGGASHGQKK